MKQHKYLNAKQLKIALPSWLFLPLMGAYCELLLHLWAANNIRPGSVLTVLGVGLAFGCLLSFLTSLLPWEKTRKGMVIFWSIALAVLYLMEYFLNDSYQVFMGLSTVIDGAGGVLDDYASLIADLLLRNLWRIGIVLLPVALYAIFAREEKVRWMHRGGLVLAAAILIASCVTACYENLIITFNFDSAVRTSGLATSLVADLFSSGSAAEPEFVVVAPTTTPTEAPETTAPSEEAGEPTEETEPPVVYGDQVLGYDFAALAESETKSAIASLHSYVASLTPAKENAYTGLFKGKNLIFITAEAFAAEVIDPELTPTLYRLATKGIHFTDYYQPSWGGSTSTGEFSNLTGLVAASGTNSIKESMQQDMFLTIGNQLRNLGYFSIAYHNHTYTYYDRHKTHVGMGYDTFIGYGNGIEEGVQKLWPESDLEMMRFTVDQYIDQEPFSVYYMTVSGHCLYNQLGNKMSGRNYEAVAHLDCSETVKCYLAAQLELEYALQYLVTRLEEEGIADDTVIVLGTDHYPYGLEQSSTWGNTKNYLAELYGYVPKTEAETEHNALIIWSGCLEDMGLVVDTPVYSLDILPTLSNLFDVNYDSRLLVGRDVFSDQEPIVLWPDYSWKTEYGFYDSSTGTFIPEEGVEVPEGYVDRIKAIVQNKISYSRAVQENDYFNYISPSVLGVG